MSRTPEQLYDRGQNNLSARARIAGSVTVRLMTVPGLAALISACGGGSEATPTTPSPAISVEVQTPSPTVAGATQSTETSSPKPTDVITPSPTEASVDQPCLVLPQEYCNQGQVLEQELDGIRTTLIAFKLPVGTSIIAPADGQFSSTELQQPYPLKGKIGLISNQNDPDFRSYNFVGDLAFTNASPEVKKGDTIGTIQETGIDNLGDYNFLVAVYKFDPSANSTVSDQEVLARLFPQALSNS